MSKAVPSHDWKLRLREIQLHFNARQNFHLHAHAHSLNTNLEGEGQEAFKVLVHKFMLTNSYKKSSVCIEAHSRAPSPTTEHSSGGKPGGKNGKKDFNKSSLHLCNSLNELNPLGVKYLTGYLVS